ANVTMTVNGIELETPAPGATAILNPRVEEPVLIGTESSFGFEAGDNGITPISGLSEKVVAAAPTAATLSSDKQVAAILSSGGVLLARVGTDPVVVVDSRAGLIPPSLDPFHFVWSAQGGSAAS